MANTSGLTLPFTPGIPVSQETPGSKTKNAIGKDVKMNRVTTNRQVSELNSATSPRQRRATQSHQKIVFSDPVAFRYLEEDPSTIVLDRRRRLEGYELYVVEQWACSRSHPTFLICTYTGDSSQSILVNVLSVPSDEDSWSPRLKIYFQAVSEFHAKKKETPLGTLMVTNLSSFPSTLTVIIVPDGDVRKHREDFMVNEALKRMGCSGRAAMNIQPPLPSTVAKYHQLYHTSENVPTYQSVMELVKMCQTALVIYGLLLPNCTDGLLCDLTEKAIGDWWTEIGIYFYNIEPKDGILGPTTVAALLGLLIGAFNRLKTSSASVGKDVLDINSMKRAVGHFQKSQKMEKSRRLDRETLDRLHRATAKTASGEGWNVPKAVKSTVAELSGKGGEMLMGIAGGRDKAGISDAETLDIERFAQLVTGPRMKWLWQGKHMKSTEIFGTSPGESQGRAFGTDEMGMFIWTDSKNQPPGVQDLERTETTSTYHPEMKSGFGRIRDAVGGFKSHSQRPSREIDGPSESSEVVPTAVPQRPSFQDQKRSSDHVLQSSYARRPPALNMVLAEAPTSASPGTRDSPKTSRQSYEMDRSHREQLKSVVSAESPGKKKIQAEMADLRHEFESNVYQNFSAAFLYKGPRSMILRRSLSAIHIVDLGPDRPRENRLQRQVSFSLVENMIYGSSEDFASLNLNDSPFNQSPSAGIAALDAITVLAQKRVRNILRVQQALIPYTESKVGQIEAFDRDAQEHLEELTNLYYQRLEEYQALRATSSEIVMQEKTTLTDSLRRIEMLGAKLDYELNALQSRMQEVEDAVDEFDRSVRAIEAKASGLIGSEDANSTPWFQRLGNLWSLRK